MLQRMTNARPLAGATMLCALLCAIGCDGAKDASTEASSESQAESSSENIRTYRVRGQISVMPDPASPLAELQIHHEQIPDFHGWDGKLNISSDGVPGMKSMTMPFDTDPPELLDGLGVGDKVRFTMVTDLEAKRYWISTIEKLDPSTELDYTNKIP